MTGSCPANQEASIRPWRKTASKVVEELFPATPEAFWNDLLDLRGLLLRGEDWTEVIECFLKCRRSMEEDHYLPFYRLRKILCSHLCLENHEVSLESLLRKRDFSFRTWREKVARKGRMVALSEGSVV